MSDSGDDTPSPVQVDDDTDIAQIAHEFEDRLTDLLAEHKLEPTAEGWRTLALQLALRHETSFTIETPVDRVGRSGVGGRPVGFSVFIARSLMKQTMASGMSQKAAAKIVHKWLAARSNKPTKPASLANMMSENRVIRTPDVVRRSRYEAKALHALEAAADTASQKWRGY